MKKTTIGVIGQGFVGNAVYQGFKDYYNVLTYDKYLEDKSNSTLEDIVKNSDIIFTCVPTPMTDIGNCYVGIVEEVLEDVNNICKTFDIKDKICIIKSTVIPGTTKKMNEKFKNLNVIFNPEFLTEANAVVTNCFLATKVSFANEIYQICEEMNIDYDKVIEYAQYDSRLGNSHWSVPGPDGDMGFGGHCFPKDIQALMYEAFKLGVEPTMLAATIAKNNMVRNERDWEDMDGRAVIRTNNFETIASYSSIEELRDEIEVEDENQLKLDLDNGIS